MGKYALLFGLFVSLPSFAAFQCGGYKMTLSDAEGLVRINGELVTSQKVKYLGAQGDESKAVWNMGLMPARDGNNYGFEFVKRNGKSFLNVQLLQNSMDAPKIIGSFPCKKVQD
ncbi:hypothetical protein K9B91_002147 [Salmonella enterica subsp. enterica serovar Give]|uniref:Secreted protein n=4 Tax=Salmonella enterica TaxID=28901 RepID=A0A5V0PY40_SALER|nr:MULTISPECIES: hypothetical protein [Salmonella]EAA6777341.1 hypothetical protein [Salmonella enterica subsp. enterica serovar Braenderup]EAM4445554.1 hypothetical protein [Salmonella enterica subsp. enterica serovar Infantis]EAP4143819.1 hypothetical protein [Salmonella enterica subsp. enterica serovar Anatum]EBH8220073.1 hypothetical protein [Salmonella enterica subsp. enterica serovar Agona str. SL483]EBH8417947.1 hypothetical protein [Salmonella enterica subsp. enterica serovar Nijmegen]